MDTDSRLYGVSMRGWICMVLTIALSASVLMKIPIDTQFFTIYALAWIIGPDGGRDRTAISG